MFVAWSPLYCHPLPAGHRFPMEKYELIPQQLLYEGIINQEHIHQPSRLSEELILWTHDKAYWNKLKNLQLSRQEERKTGFPLSARLVEREITIAQGTIDGVLHALQTGKPALNVAGGTHHAYTASGEGFCLLNDQAMAANYLLRNKLAKQILIVDLDVHQGNGTAQIFQKEPRVFTFSMHGAKNYPAKKEQSDLDIALPDDTTDSDYLNKLSNTLPGLLDEVQPDFVFYLSGVDVLATDKLGRLGLTIEGCKQRDAFVLETFKRVNLPVQISMGGGYSPDIRHIVEAHVNTYRLVKDLFY